MMEHVLEDSIVEPIGHVRVHHRVSVQQKVKAENSDCKLKSENYIQMYGYISRSVRESLASTASSQVSIAG